MRYCPHCGERVEPEDAYCFECGTALGAPPDADRDQPRGREQSGGRDRGREHGQAQEPATSPGQVESLTTLWVATGLAALAVLEGLGAVLFADELAEQVQEFGFGGEITAGAIAAQGGLGIAVALAVAALCYYYYRQGYVDRRFFWGLVIAGVGGFFFGSAVSFLLIIGVGAYGLLVVLRRDRSGNRPPRASRR